MDEGAPLLVVSALLVAPMLSGCVAVGFLDEPGTSPDWQAGYSWEHERSGRIQGEIVRDGETVEEVDETVDGVTVNRTVVNTTLEAGGEPIYVLQKRIEREGFTGSMLEAVRQRDLAPVPRSVAVSTSCVGDACSTEVNHSFGKAPEWTFLDFPLVPGKTWTIDPPSDPDDLDVEIHAEVGAARTVDLPIGATEVLPVTFTVEPVNLDEKLDDAEERMEDHGARIDRLDVDLDLRLRIDWSPDHQVPARVERTTDVEATIAGTTEDGEPIDMELRFSGSMTDALADVHLEPGPERAPSEVEADGVGSMVTPPAPHMMGIPPVPPTGPSPDDDGGIRIVAEEHRPNAAEGEEVEIRILGADDAAEGAELRWSIRHPDHGHLDAGTGDRFEHRVTEPGQHLVEARLVGADGQVIARDSLSLLARWSQETEMSCDVVETAYVGGCDPVAFPVASGVQQLVVALDPDGARAGYDELRVLDAGGETVGSSGGPDYVVAIDDFSGTAVDGSAWTAEYGATAAAFNSPQIHVEARYRPVIDDARAETASSSSAAWRAPMEDLISEAVDWSGALDGGPRTPEAIP